MKLPKKIHLANLPTPLEKINFKGKRFLIKRDDYTGTDYSGNKIRKLEYLLARANRRGAKIIFTCGGEQSNHCRATVSAAAKLGMKTRLFLWGRDSINSEGNLFLSKMYGSEISFLNKKNYLDVNQIMTEESEQLIKKGKKVYVIPEGGSTTLGIWGYISFITELKKQINLDKVDGIFSAAGSGGTAAGMLVGEALNNFDINIYIVNVLYSKEEIRKRIMFLVEGVIAEYKLKCSVDESRLIILDGYSKEGYKNITDNKIKVISDLAKNSGILLDPPYTGKAFYAFNERFLKKGKGNNIIFLHSGGIFGTFPKNKKYLKNV
ncbi:MAG: pyridoxal-phosphate dependent enzyme [Ignavibacteria bacterium]|jgi:D-cysteine desulfhydrase